MRYSFKGAFRNAMNAVKELEEAADEELEEGESNDWLHADRMNAIGSISSCLELYHDVILGLLKGDVTHDQAREFLCLEGEELDNAKYDGGVVKITKG